MKAYLLNGTVMLMVSVGTFIYGKYVLKDGFKNIGWKIGKPVDYLKAILTVSIIWIFPLLIEIFNSQEQIILNIISMEKIGLILTFLTVIILFEFGEEFGWREYFLPKLMNKYSPRKALLIQGVFSSFGICQLLDLLFWLAC